ncbi:response regulator, partial [Pseudomonas savastanoi pv. glycinea str. race 4]
MTGDFRILIIDDQRPNLDLMEQLLAREGLTNVLSSTEPLRTLDLFNSFEPDLVVLDLHMPEFDGFAVLEQLNRRISANDYLPIMVRPPTRHAIPDYAHWRWAHGISSASRWMRWKPCCVSGTCWKPALCINRCASWCRRKTSSCCA